MNAVVYDAGALIAIDRRDRRALARHAARLDAGFSVSVPATVVAQVSRSAQQVMLRRLLASVAVVPFDQSLAHEVGALVGRAGTSDIVDGSVVVLAQRTGAGIVTADVGDIRALCEAAGISAVVLEP